MEKARNNESGDNIEVENTSISSSSLPCDILLDIISRVPILCLPKDLLRTAEHTRFHILATNNSEFVRHRWEQSLTTNPSVIALNPGNTRFYFAEDYRSYDTATEIDIGLDESKWYKVSGICHGIVCLTNLIITYPDFSLDVYLWNPVTREKLRIECPNANLPRTWYCEVVVGFGCLQDATDYKVLRLYYELYSADGFTSYASVYSLCLNSWRDVPNVSKIKKLCHSDEHAMVNDSLHWLAALCHDLYDRILAFNMKDETFQVMQIPFSYCATTWRSHVPSLHVMELGGQLCVYDMPIDGELQVWVMKEYGVCESWTTLFKIGGTFTQLRPLGVANNGEIILKKNTLSFQQLMLYNAETKEVKKFKPFTHKHYNQAYAFTPSLITLKEEDKDGE